VDLIRDVLDKSVVDRNGRDMGRVDGIVVQVEAGQPPRAAEILIGPAALASRLHPGLVRFVSAVEKRFGINRERPVRIDFADVEQIDRKVQLRLTIGDTAVGAIEDRIRRWLLNLPGSR